jgi:hypothetical protein
MALKTSEIAKVQILSNPIIKATTRMHTATAAFWFLSKTLMIKSRQTNPRPNNKVFAGNPKNTETKERIPIALANVSASG